MTQRKIDITGTLNVTEHIYKVSEKVATINDLNESSNEILNVLFPIGTIYLTNENVNPQEAIGVGEWIFYKTYNTLFGWCRIE